MWAELDTHPVTLALVHDPEHAGKGCGAALAVADVAAAVAEVLTFGGVPSVLFLDVPTPDRLAAFAGVRGVGIAGTARAQSPEWMEANLSAVYRFLATLPGGPAPLTHYKVCSTLDSSPIFGSIGRAIDLAPHVPPGREIGRASCRERV